VYQQRQTRLRVLEALEAQIKQFRRREELWPLRVPPEPILLQDLIDRALQDGRRALDPGSLRSRTLLSLEWDDGSAWDLWMTVLPSGFKVYCDSIDEESRLLASGGRNEGDESDRIFLQLLAESAGAHFGIEMSGGAPTRVRTSIADRGFLIDVFVELFEVTGAEASVRDQLPAASGHTGPAAPTDFRDDVERWLAEALRRASTSSRDS
jgi:hypothetical protein